MNLHTVTITQNYDEEVALEPTVEFACSGDATSECHMYPGPDCQCESWTYSGDKTTCEDCGVLRIAHDECWAQAWFDNDHHEYVGADADESGDYGLPTGSRSGSVNLDFTGERLDWTWAETLGVSDDN